MVACSLVLLEDVTRVVDADPKDEAVAMAGSAAS